MPNAKVLEAKKQAVDDFRTVSENLYLKNSEIENEHLNIKKDGVKRSCFNLMSYNDVSRETILKIWPELEKINKDVYEQVEIEAKYAGYIKRQLADIEVFKKDENLKIRDDIDSSKIGGLSREMVQKLTKIKPQTIGEASRISGVTPAAITAILGFVDKK